MVFVFKIGFSFLAGAALAADKPANTQTATAT